MKNFVSKNNPKSPAFLCIGAQRTASSWLYEILRQHKELWLPPVKELHYLDEPRLGSVNKDPARAFRNRNIKYLSKFKTLISRRFWGRRFKAKHPFLDLHFMLNYLRKRPDFRFYSGLFQPAANRGYLAGEATPAYALLPPDKIHRLYDLNPNLRIIFIMRDPIERAWSHLIKDLCRNRGRSPSDLKESEIKAFLFGDACVARSDYAETLQAWLSVFPTSQMYFGCYHRMTADPRGFLSDIFEFLSVDSSLSGLEGLNMKVNSTVRKDYDIPKDINSMLMNFYRQKVLKLNNYFSTNDFEWMNKYISGSNE